MEIHSQRFGDGFVEVYDKWYVEEVHKSGVVGTSVFCHPFDTRKDAEEAVDANIEKFKAIEGLVKVRLLHEVHTHTIVRQPAEDYREVDAADGDGNTETK